MNDCIFCKIVAKEIPATIVYEDKHTIAFLDIKPLNLGHTLVIPKTHAKNILDIDADSFAKVMITAQKMSKIVKEITGATGINIIINNEPNAGQLVFHSHVHVIPRFHDDGYKLWKPTKTYGKEEVEILAEKIRRGA